MTARLLAEAMRADEHFAREVGRLLMVDDLLRQSGAPDDRAFLDAFALRLAAEREGGEFVREFERRVRDGGRPAPPRRTWLPWTIAAAACVASVLAGGLAIRRRPGVAPPRPPAVTRADRQTPAGGDRRITSGNALAMVVKLDGVEWEPGGGPAPDGGGPPGGRPAPASLGVRHAVDAHRRRARRRGPGGLELVRRRGSSATGASCGPASRRRPRGSSSLGRARRWSTWGMESGLNIGPDGQCARQGLRGGGRGGGVQRRGHVPS